MRLPMPIRDTDRVFANLEKSPFRRRFHLGVRERAYLERKGPAEILEHARDFVMGRLAPANPANDGRQTPFRGHPVFVAQHATATCCRSCLAKWHGIAPGRPLDAREVEDIVAVLERWLQEEARGERSPIRER